MWSILKKICVCLRVMCILFLVRVFCIFLLGSFYLKCNSSPMCPHLVSVYMIFHCWSELSTSPTIIVLLSVSPFRSFSNSFVYVGTLLLDLYILYCLEELTPLSLYNDLFLFLEIFDLKLFFFFWWKYTYFCFLVYICMDYLPIPSFSVCVSLSVKLVFCRNHILVLFFGLFSHSILFDWITFSIYIQGNIDRYELPASTL